MKKLFNLILLCVACVLTFSSCSKDDENKESTYTLIYNSPTPWGEESVILFEYNSVGDKIKNNSIECEKGYTETFTASPNTEKVKVYADGKWIQQVFFLQKGGNIVIEVNGSSIIGNEEP